MISLSAAAAAMTDNKLNPTTFSQCQPFWKAESLGPFTIRYIWFARTNVRGNVLRRRSGS